MKRDFNLIRKILIELEEHPKKDFTGSFNLDGYEQEFIDHHLELMKDANLIRGNFRYGDNRLLFVSIKITNQGYDFLDNARNDTVWSRTMDKVKELGGGVSLEIFKDLLMMTAKTYIIGQ